MYQPTITNSGAKPRSAKALATAIAATLLLLAACQPVAPGASTGTVPGSSLGTPTPAPAHNGHAVGEIPVAQVVVSGAGIEIPADLPAGPVQFDVTLTNDAPGTPMIARFIDGKGIVDLGAALAQMTTAGPAALFEVVSLYGGGEGARMADFTLDLQPGEHVAVVLGEGAPLLQPFDVLLNEIEPEPPVASVEATMVDYAFELPETIATGEQVWRFVNEGGQWHETVVFKAEEGVSIEDFIAAASGEEQSANAPEMAFVWTPASVGEQGWATIDLPAGDYVVICFLPDLAGDMSPHYAHGMVRNLHVE